MEKPRLPTARVRAHIDKLREAGLDTQKFFEALSEIRDDSALPQVHREALYRLIGMESFIWYLEAIRGEPVDRMKAAEEAMRIAAENDVAIKKRTPGDSAAALVTKEIGAQVRTSETGAAPRAASSTAPPRAAAKPGAAPRRAGPRKGRT